MAKKKPAAETPDKTTQIVWCCNVSAALDKKAKAEIKRRGIKGRGAKAQYLRMLMAEGVGDPSLADATKMGRPPKKRDDS